MEEKAHYSYDAKIKFSSSPPFSPIKFSAEDSAIDSYFIDQMSQLQPMAVKYTAKVSTHIGQADQVVDEVVDRPGEILVLLDFYAESVYDNEFKNITDTKLGKEIVEILKQKKAEMVGSHVPTAIIEQAFSTKKSVFEGRPDAGKI